MHLVLASQSPRRREILERAGLDFSVRVSGVPEEARHGEAPGDYVERLARSKALGVTRSPGELILAADTIVVVEGEILEKPLDDPDAARMLRRLSGRVHVVVTGYCILGERGERAGSVETRVRFVPLSEEEIREYVASGEPLDKAGAYAIQGLASKFIDRVEGCYFNVVGLPIATIYRELRALGY